MSSFAPHTSSENEPISGIINTLDVLESTISNLELDVRNEINAQRLLHRCQLNLASQCQDKPRDAACLPKEETDSYTSASIGSGYSRFSECNCRCNQALGIYLEQLRQAGTEQEELLRKLKMKEEQANLYRSKLMESNSMVEHQKQEIQALKDNEELVTRKINTALEQENETLMNEIVRLKRLPDELRERERALRVANKELQETKLTLKSLLLDIESGLDACEGISGELQQERKRAFHTLNEIDEEKRKVKNWVLKYTELKQQLDSAVQQKESVDQLTIALRDKTLQLDTLTKEYEALKKESVDYISKVDAQNEKQRTELQEKLVELECENLRLKIALEKQCLKTSEVSHGMQRELINLEQKFVEAQEEVQALKRYNEVAAATAEYGVRNRSLPGEENLSADSKSLTPPYCSVCPLEDGPEKDTSQNNLSVEQSQNANDSVQEGSIGIDKVSGSSTNDAD